TTTTGGGKARLESLRENLFKQQERLLALRERALRKADEGGRLKGSMSDSMESLKSLGHKLSSLPTATAAAGATATTDTSLNELLTTTPSKQDLEFSGSGSEKLQMLNQRTEQNRALLEQRKRDMARSLQSVKSGLPQSVSGELGASMNDLRTLSQTTPVSRHRSVADLQQQQPQATTAVAASTTATTPADEGRVKLLKNKMKLIELKQTRKEQELQQELHELRQQLTQREQQVQQLESTLVAQSEQLQQLRAGNAELQQSSELLESTRLELQEAREQLLLAEQQNSSSTDAQVNQELAKQLQALQQQLLDSQQPQLNEELPTDSDARQHVTELEESLAAQSEQLAEKTNELNVLQVNLRVLEEKLTQSVKSKPIFLVADEDVQANAQLQAELQQLRQKLDESNKSNIKLKLKCKQAEKQLQQLQNSDAQQQLTELQQRLTVLEDEKGQWQLAHVEEEPEDEREDRAEQLSQLQANVSELEQQKQELQQALEALQRGSETARLSSSSSAESIEMVERPSERRFSQPEPDAGAAAEAEVEVEAETVTETEAVQLPSFVSELTQTDVTATYPEVSESLLQMRAESDELLKKIKLFAHERREVLAKMEELRAENARQQQELEQQTAQLKNSQEQLEELQREKQQLSLQLSEKQNLSQELSSMQRSSEVVAALDGGDAGVALLDKCERSLGKLSSELEAYRKANDRNAKLNVSKKLAKEAKNVHTQLTELLHKVKEASTAVETVTVVETVVAVTAPNGKALAEYEQLTAQNVELKTTLAALQAELEELRDSWEPAEAPKLAITEQERDQELQQLRDQQQEQQLAAAQELQALREQLQATIAELRGAESEHLELIASQSAELVQLQLQAEHHDNQLNASEMAHEKQLEQQQRQRRELQARNESLEGELGILQALVAEQKQQLIESYSEREHEANLKLLELQQCQQELETSEARNRELREKLKKYALQLKKRAAEQAELQARQAAEQQASSELAELQQRLQQAEQQELQVQAELKRLQQQLAASERENDELQQQLTSSERENDELQQQAHKHKSKLAKLEKEADRLQVELQNTVHANTALRQESYQLEQTLAERAGDGDSNNRLLEELRRQLDQKSIKFDKSKEVIKHRNATIQSLQRELAELRAQLQAQPEEEAQQQQLQQQLQLEKQQEQLQQLQAENAALLAEKANFELVIARLETLHEGIQAKLLQDQSYMETLEAQGVELQQKNATLESQTSALQSEHAAQLERVEQLAQQLEQRNAQQLEHESQLQQRLQQLQAHEQTQSRQLQLLGSEADEVREQLANLQAEHDSLLARHKQQTQQALAEREQHNSSVEQELHELREQLQQRQLELQRQRNVYDAKLAAKATELDEMECDLSAHMERASGETRELLQRLERSQEQLQARGDELTRLGEELADVERERASLSREVTLLRLQQDSAEQDVLELQELRMQVLQDKTEMDNLRSQIDALCANHNQELQALQQQLAELDTLGQNQTDDQVYIETENKRLTEQLIELQARLDEQSEQLARHQLAAAPPPNFAATPYQATPQAGDNWMSADAAAAPSPFDEIVAQPLRVSSQGLGVPQDHPLTVEPTIEDLQRNVSDLEKHAKELETKLLAHNQALAEHEERRQQLERLLAEREQELTQLRTAAEERERLAAIEQLIQAEPVTTTKATAAPAPAPTLDMFFGAETVTDAGQLDLGLPQAEPVVEPLITPKKAYLCQPDQQQQQQQQQQVVVDWGVDEDPWASAAADEQQVRPAVEQQLQQRIEELEQQKLELQTKTAKLMKRVKEYRSKEQTKSSSNNSNSNDLDSAIMDELRHQLQLHEARQAKSEELQQQHALEKEKLAKRIDVLTAGNERMAELKERQDMDVQMYQARIRELQDKLQQLESWGEGEAPTTVATVPTPAATAETQTAIENLQAENQELNSECQELQAQLQLEKQQALEVLAQAQREREQLQLEKQRALEALAQQAEQERCQLHEQLQADQQQALAAQQEREQLQLQLEELKAKQLELPTSVTAPSSDESMALLQEKESEIVHLKQRIEELMREDQTEKLVLEILTKNQELQLLRMQIKQLEEDKLEAKPASTNEAAQLEQQLELQQVRQQCEQLQQEKSDMEEELRVLNNHVLSCLQLEDKMKQTVLELDTKTIEITELRKSLELLQQSPPPPAQAQAQPAVSQPSQQDLSVLNQQWEALVEQKCSEVASIWQEHLAQREAAYQAQIEQLTTAAAQQQQQQQPPITPTPAVEQPVSATPAEDSEMLGKMQKALETQEMEIVTLKEQLAIRSAEYARLASQYDPFRLQNTLGGGGAAAGAAGGAAGAGATGSISQEPLPEYVLKADLDYALMMLHQRDMRVEEMILELVQLLEERDHLQLKLSDTLRQLEAERSTQLPQRQRTAIPAAAEAVTSNRSKWDATSKFLEQLLIAYMHRLAELQTVKHSKDKAIVDEREQRLRQMIQLQRDMSKTTAAIPATDTTTTTTPAAAAASAAITSVTAPPTVAAMPPTPQLQQQQTQLEVDASQSSLRSPSMVLMDWILGNNKSEEEVHPSSTA
ncbi:hypothetical protein KR093_008086, partial [Drosophila rubida]